MEFRFDAARHEYTDLVTGRAYPHITGLLERDGLSSSAWCTEESRIRGTAVHRLTADYDLGALTLAGVPESDPFRPYLAAHVAAMAATPHTFEAVEEPRVHATWKYGGRTDRAGTVYELRAVLEVKSGEPTKAHPIQTALQAILEADRWGIPPDMVGRFCLYLKPNGRYRLEEFTRVRDFDRAFRILRDYAG